jgi:hypothetical protein
MYHVSRRVPSCTDEALNAETCIYKGGQINQLNTELKLLNNLNFFCFIKLIKNSLLAKAVYLNEHFKTFYEVFQIKFYIK